MSRAQNGDTVESGRLVDVKVPDIGDFDEVPIIDLFVKIGDSIGVDDSICTLESDKAAMDIPSPEAGVVKEVLVQVGDQVSEGGLLIRIESNVESKTEKSTQASSVVEDQSDSQNEASEQPVSAPLDSIDVQPPPVAARPFSEPLPESQSKAHASPSVRAYARELGVDIARVSASGEKQRVLKEDVTAYVKETMGRGATHGGASGNGLDLIPWPQIDFAKFGEIEKQPLSRINKISAQNLSRNWVMIPAVTYHEDADITDLEAFRVQLNQQYKDSGIKITMLAFIIKACVKALQQFPLLNSALDQEQLVLKKYYHIGFAADTPHGLVVPVIKDADQKTVPQIAQEASALAKSAREGKLKPSDMQGSCFTVSSLGGIGGVAFSPIINAPEVAILGVCKSATKPVWDGEAFQPRLILPLSLTADHRVIDGALATRFNVYLSQLLADMRLMIV